MGFILPARHQRKRSRCLKGQLLLIGAVWLSVPCFVYALELNCREKLDLYESQFQAANINDPGSHSLPGYPHLRTNRWLAFLQQQVSNDAQGEQWVALAEREGLAYWQQMLKRLGVTDEAINETNNCIAELTEFTAFPGIPQTDIQDAYSGLMRTLGFYPISKHFAGPSIKRYRTEMNALFQRPPSKPKRYYIPAPFSGAPPPPDALDNNPLNIPNPGSAATQALLSHYAPVLAIANTQEHNLPGTLNWREDSIGFNPEQPNAYTWLSWTNYLGHNLLQLNYLFWFSERPAESRFDLYSGKLDGLIWRVTLKPDGNVLLYDSIHACGCYHKIFPVARGIKPNPDDPDPPIFYNRLAPNANQQPIQISIRADDHYVLEVSRAPNVVNRNEALEYNYLDAETLSYLQKQDGSYKSLFNSKGIIEISQRRERFLLWPLGVPSAGAMRQEGTHAISFLEKRHFDDARLFERIFAKPFDN